MLEIRFGFRYGKARRPEFPMTPGVHPAEVGGMPHPMKRIIERRLCMPEGNIG